MSLIYPQQLNEQPGLVKDTAVQCPVLKQMLRKEQQMAKIWVEKLSNFHAFDNLESDEQELWTRG